MKTALITGSTRGIGRAIALELAKMDYNIILNSVSGEHMDEVKKEIENLGKEVIGIKADLRKKDEIKKLIEKSIKKFGKIDLLINNSGVAYFGDFSENTEEQIDNTLDVNIKGLIYCTKEIIPHMLKEKSGIIINIASGLGKHTEPGLAVYCASKFAVVGFTKAIADELEQKGIKVFSVYPTGTTTRMYKQLFGKKGVHEPEDVALEVRELLENIDDNPVGSAIDVKKHI